ncbi:MAG: DEAD/DEAH box helicase [Proteobacteria bacterium]|nr:DEAD/DEAH box helicase [Pseudomonadota bacterium]
MNTPAFRDLNLIDPLLKALDAVGYTHPTPIQLKAIPPLLEGHDLLGCAQTGTGKTAAFALPLIQNLKKNPIRYNAKQPRILVLTPTRELAIQVHDNFVEYSKFVNLKTSVIFGGVGQAPQVKSMLGGVDVLVATPGRLLDLINQRHVSLRELEVFVLDEADRMLDMGFIHDIKKIIALLPEKRHNLFFSATMPKEIEQLANTILRNPIRVAVAPVSSTAELIEQRVMFVDKDKKRDLLKHLFQDPSLSKVIIFTRTKHGANKVSEVLTKAGIKSDAIHGNKSQTARQNALNNFKDGKIRALIATDIAARGIDVDDITHVINFELPHEPESYVHRIGRTARAGAKGKAIAFCDAEEKSLLKQIEKVIKMEVPLDPNQPYHSDAVEGARILKPGQAKALIESRGPSRAPQRGRRPQEGRRPSEARSGEKPRSDNRFPKKKFRSPAPKKND